MNATPSRSFPPLNSLPCADDGIGSGQKYQSNILAQSFGPPGSALATSAAHEKARMLARRKPVAIHAEGFEAWFVPALSVWLQTNFENAEHVARAFGVRFQTALNWWNGAHCAKGSSVGLIFMRYSAARDWFMSEWEARG